MKFPWIIIRRRRLEILEDEALELRGLVKGMLKALGKTQDWLEREHSLVADLRKVINYYRTRMKEPQ